MPYSRVSYTGDNTTTQFTIPFPFLRPETLQVRVNDVLKTLGTDYTVNSGTSKVVFGVAPVVEYDIDIKRVTPRGTNDRLVVFTDPADIRAESLNNSDLQLLYILQEALDDIASGVGVGYPVGDPDPEAPLPVNVQDALDGLNDDLTAALLVETNARVAAILAEANARAAAVLGEANARTAAIASEATTRQTADTSLASSITVINAALVDGTTGLPALSARITAEAASRVSGDSAAATRLTTLESTVNNPSGGVSNLSARLTTVEGALTGGTSPEALAFRVTELEASVESLDEDVGTLTARISSEESTRATQDSALAARVTTVESSIGTLSASVSTEASARITADGNLASEYVLAVATDGPGGARRVTGFRITNQGGGGGGTEFVIQTDKFQLVNSSGAGARIPFQVVGGVVYLDTATIQALSASKISAGTISAAAITLDGAGGILKSNNYVAGTSGFKIDGTGFAEFKEVIIRDAVVVLSTPQPTLSPGSKDFLSAFSVTLSAASGTIRYTTDGSEVTAASTAYSSPISVSVTTVIRARAFNVAGSAGPEAVGVYTLVPAPVPGPAGPSGPTGPAATFTLSLSGHANPLYPPTGAGTYPAGTLVAIGTPHPAGGDNFINWSSGSPFDMDFVENPNSAATYVLMNKNISLIANY